MGAAEGPRKRRSGQVQAAGGPLAGGARGESGGESDDRDRRGGGGPQGWSGPGGWSGECEGLRADAMVAIRVRPSSAVRRGGPQRAGGARPAAIAILSDAPRDRVTLSASGPSTKASTAMSAAHSLISLRRSALVMPPL